MSRRALALLAPLFLTACPAPAPQLDSGAMDAAIPDTGGPDASPADASAESTAPLCTFTGAAEAPIPTPRLHTPRWSFEPWISKDISDTADTYAFVDGFRTRDIPVGVVVLDSPWETNYHSFVPNPSRYSNFQQLVNDLHSRNVRLVLWMTQFNNSSSYDAEIGGDIYDGPAPTYEEGRRCRFYIDNNATFPWWKGIGASVDFFNDRARAWWHRQQDALLAMGVDGWKLDFGDSYVRTSSDPNPPIQTAQGTVTHQQYSEEYYRDFWAYGVQQRGRDFVSLVRPYDVSYDIPARFYARPEHSPIAWVGDNRRDWVGMADALDEIFRSAAAGYVVLGSDVGGYLDRDDQSLTTLIPACWDCFAHWTAVGALSPFMQLHGRANLTPWTIPERTDEMVALYRYWSHVHHELVPFYYSLAEESAAAATPQPIVHPQGAMTQWPGDYRYMLGEAFLVAPVLDSTGARDVALPEGRWFDWWSPGADAITGSQTLHAVDTSRIERLPLYVREGALVPLEVDSPVTGLGTAAATGQLTVASWPALTASRFVLHDADDSVATITAVRTATTATLSIDHARRPVVWRVRWESPVTSVRIGSTALAAVTSSAAFDAAATGYWYDSTQRTLWVRGAADTNGQQLSVQ